MKKFTFSLLIFSGFIYCLYAQYVNVRISSVIYGEEWISINPKNTNQMVVGVIGNYSPSNSNMGSYYSNNAGLNWNGGPLVTTFGTPISDPVVIVDTAGNFYYLTMCGTNPVYYLLCSKSTDGGMNWNDGTRFAQLYPKFDDMPMACVDFSSSQYRNNIYVTWTLYDTFNSYNPNDSSYVYFSSSSDQANTFSTPSRIGRIAGPSYSDNASPEGPVPCTGTNGEIYVCFPHNEQVYFNRSTNAGNTWLSEDIFVSSQIGGWVYHHSPVIACDLSNSTYRGNLYICFSDLRNGSTDRDIWLTKSTNRGVNWSNIVRVNNDAAGHNQELPWICVDQVTGYIWIIFCDSRNYSSQTTSDVYVARSTDGGNTFQNTKVSTSSIFTGSWFGDYMGISAYNNEVRPVWTRYINGMHNELWTAIIDSFVIGIQPISNKIPEKFLLFQNYPNPFNPTTKIKFSLPGSLKEGMQTTQLVIYDLQGREVTTLVNEKLNPGTYEVEWNASNFSNGIYFYKLQTELFSETKKLVLIK